MSSRVAALLLLIAACDTSPLSRPFDQSLDVGFAGADSAADSGAIFPDAAPTEPDASGFADAAPSDGGGVIVLDGGGDPRCTQENFDDLARVFRAEVTRQGAPGAALAILCGGDRIFSTGAGVTDLTSNTPVTGATRFQLASVTKMMTAATALRLAEEGLVNLSAPITSHVPFVNTQRPYNRSFTLSELLSHSSGYPTELFGGNFDSLSLEPFFRANTNYLLWAPPGEVFSYNNLGYALAGLTLQRAAGQPFALLVQSRIFQPAGMAGATMDAAALEMAGNYATGYTESPTNPVSPSDEYLSSEFYGPMGGAWANAEDLAPPSADYC